MGGCASAPEKKSAKVKAEEDAKKDGKSKSATGGYKFTAIKDSYETLEEVADALHNAGLESSNLIVAIDFTKSNQWTGKRTFNGRSLHYIDKEDETKKNPYIQATEVIGKVLAQYDDDNQIPVYGFGDSTTLDRGVFPPANGFLEITARYKEIVPKVVMAGPTNFAPAIEMACQIVEQSKQYHILLIVADGQVTNQIHSINAIVKASSLPLSIVLVGVGDGPWDMMEEFDDALPDRQFDNFQFVNFSKVYEDNPKNPDVAFALAALMEIPEQFQAIRKLGLIG